jgi:hypothetical protein
MNDELLSVPVLAAITFVGPVTVVARLVPPIAPREPAAERPQTASPRVLHRTSVPGATCGAVVPVSGIAVWAGRACSARPGSAPRWR